MSEIPEGLPILGRDGYEAWRYRSANWSSQAVPYGPVSADDNGNGVPNLLAYAFNLNDLDR